VDRPVRGKHGSGIRQFAHGDQGQRGHAQPVGFVAQTDVDAKPGVSGARA